mmetsp:Transcript_4925/g.8928  ORF Transcript_4925/g.8928 Transcript_4925/m.8928 type:complete len:153 (-) Transcript_4925:193-651(-)
MCLLGRSFVRYLLAHISSSRSEVGGVSHSNTNFQPLREHRAGGRYFHRVQRPIHLGFYGTSAGGIGFSDDAVAETVLTCEGPASASSQGLTSRELNGVTDHSVRLHRLNNIWQSGLALPPVGDGASGSLKLMMSLRCFTNSISRTPRPPCTT